jgi:hypothetical protein
MITAYAANDPRAPLLPISPYWPSIEVKILFYL